MLTIDTAYLKFDSDKKKLRKSDLIISDEASMIPKKALEIVNNTLQDVCNNKLPFGVRIILLGDDIRQI
ncbi:hypothetical protein JGE77_25585 [Salmonella enterica subsp. enterica serovar Typhimurium]|nr:hypothetical protein [Salmonella enterica subsp. enterica serovar Typhimurium]